MGKKAKFLTWLLGGCALLLWTIVMAAAFWAIGFGGNLAALHADQIPGSPLWVDVLAGAARLFAGFGQVVVFCIWLAISLIMLWSVRFVGRFVETYKVPEKGEGGEPLSNGSQ